MIGILIQLQAQTESNVFSVQSSYTCKLSSTSSTSYVPLSLINTYGSNLSIKLSNSIRLFFENVNGFSTYIKTQRMNFKYEKLPCLQKKLDINIISIIKIQVNPILLEQTNNIPF